MGVGVDVAVASSGVSVGVAVGVALAVAVRVAVELVVGVPVGEGVAVTVRVDVGVGVGPSSFLIVPTPWARAIVAWVAFVRFTKKVSSASVNVSPTTGTVIVVESWPAKMIALPDLGW